MVRIEVSNFQSIKEASILVDRFTVITGPNNSGKALAHGTKVATPTGWVGVEYLSVGQLVLAGDGTPTPITGVFSQGRRKVTVVTFDDGRQVTVDADHLWQVSIGKDRFPRGGLNQRWRALTTRQIRERLGDSPSTYNRPAIPVSGPAEFVETIQPLDPYLMGVLLGDGSFRGSSIRVSSVDGEILEQVASLVPSGVTLSKCGKCDYRLVTGRGCSNPVLSAVRGLGLLGCLSQDKWVPDVYLLGSPAQRLALLQGLMDTDGSVNRAGTAEFYSASVNLAQVVRQMVWSFGGVARLRRKGVAAYTYNGERREGLPSYTVTFRLPGVSVFRLQRKLVLLGALKRRVQPLMVGFEDAGEAECTCISVDHPSQLFQVWGHLVTHNTALHRAIRGVFQNTKGTAFIRHGEAMCSVEVDFGADGKVCWSKGTGKRDRPTYTINGGSPVYPGASVPEEVAAFGVAPIEVGGQDIWPTIAPQFVGQIFLLDRPGSALAESVADVERVGQLNRALRKSESDRRQAASALKVRLADLVDHEAEVKRFEGLDDAVAAVAALEALQKKVVVVARAITSLAGLRDRLRSSRAEMTKLAPVADFVAPSEAKAKRLLAHLGCLRDLKARYNVAKVAEAKYLGIGDVLVNVSASMVPRVIAALKVLGDLRSRFSGSRTGVDQLRHDLEQAEALLEAAEASAVEALAEFGECPTCGTPMGASS